MDNNNSLPYGAISSTSDNIPLHQSHFVPSMPGSANDDTRRFNPPDPLSLARNVHFEQPSIPGHISSTRPLSRHLNSTNINNPYRVTPIQYTSSIAHEQNIDSSSSLRDLDNSLNIDNNIPYGNNSVQNINHQLNDARTINLSNTRYFPPSWSIGEVRHTENTRVNTMTSVDNGTGRPSTAILPIIREETAPGILNASFDCINSRKLKGLKRKVRDDESDVLSRPASKHFLTEEKMAAKMHNLRISSDHCYQVNGLPSQLMHVSNGMVSDTISPAAVSNPIKDIEEHKEDDNNNMESGDSTMFVLAPGVKEALSKNTQLLPQSIIDHISKPCLAVIPWKPPNDVLNKISMHSNQNKTDDEKTADKRLNFFEDRGVRDTNQHPTAFLATSNTNTEGMYDFIETFHFEEDKMDL